MKERILLFFGLLLVLTSAAGASQIYHSLDYNGGMVGTSGTSNGSAAIDKETNRILKAKEHVFKGNWETARNRLDGYLRTYPAGRYRDEALYWFAQSSNKLSKREKKPVMVIALKEEAMEKLNLLLADYPNSFRLDDAKALKIELSGELVLMGKEGYKEYIQEIIETQKQTESDLKIVALTTLIGLEPEAAIPILETIIREQEES